MLGKAKLLKVYLSESERYKNKPLYEFLVHWLKDKGIGGVTVNRGIEGFGADKVLHQACFIELSSKLPMILEIVDAAEKIDPLIPEICAMVTNGLVFAADIEVFKYGKEQYC
jgi:PII-like signaling protein